MSKFCGGPKAKADCSSLQSELTLSSDVLAALSETLISKQATETNQR